MNFETIIVIIGGGHVCGKRTAAQSVKHELESLFKGKPFVTELIDMETYLKDDALVAHSHYSSSKSSAITVNNISDHEFPPLKPSRYDFTKLKLFLGDLKKTTGKVVIVHGLYALYDKDIRDLSNLKVFISSDADARLIRWIRRDVVEGGEKLEVVINKYLQGARAEMNDFINPTKEFSDVIMPNGPEPSGISLLVDGIVPYISKSETHLPHLRAIDLSFEDKLSYYELT